MRWAVWIVLAGCGRVGFDPLAAHDAALTIDAPASYVGTVLADGPVVYYRLDETGGTIAHDSSGHGFDATYGRFGSGTITFAQQGALANDPDPAVGMLVTDVPGTTSSASVVLPETAYVVAGDFTIEGWVIPVVPSGNWNDAFFAWDQFGISGLRCGWTELLEPIVWTYEDASAAPNRVESAGNTLTPGAWNYFVFTRVGATMSIYLHGQLVASGAVNYIVPPATATGFFGSASGIPGGMRYDEAALYDHALSATRIAAHYAAAQ